MKSTWNPKLGEGSNKLLAAFMGKDMLSGQAGEFYGGKYANQLSDLASAKKHSLEARQLEDAASITPDQFAIAQGVPQEIVQAYRTDPKSVDTKWSEIMNRADTVHMSRRAGGGNVQQIMQALQTGQQIFPVDSVSLGKRTPESAAILETLTAQKPLYSQESGQVLNVATGATRDTPLSLAKISKLEGEGPETKGTPGYQFDAILGKGSWKKLNPDAQAVVFQAMKAGFGPDQLVETMRQHYAEPSINEVLRLWSSNPMSSVELMRNSKDPATGKFDTSRFQAAIQQMLQAARGASRGAIDRPRAPAAPGSEPGAVGIGDILGVMGGGGNDNPILGNQPKIDMAPGGATHRWVPGRGIVPVR